MASNGFSKQTVSVNVTSGTTITSNLLLGATGPAGKDADGDVTGPDLVDDNALVRFDGTTGKLIQNTNKVIVTDEGILHLGPAETENPYPSARFRFSDDTGELSDSIFMAYGGGYGTLNMGSATGTAASPGNTVAGAELGAIGFLSRNAGLWTKEMRISAYDQNFPLPNGDPTGQFVFRPYPETYGGGITIGHWDNTANPANGLSLWTNTAGFGPVVTSWGSDTNIDILLRPKGTGQLKVNTGIVAFGTGGVGYATGAGGTVTQATSKATGVTLNKTCGKITLNAAALAASTTVSFVFTNSTIAATDVLVLNHTSGGTLGSYTLNAAAAAGSATIYVRNVSLASLSEAVVISYAVVKAVTA